MNLKEGKKLGDGGILKGPKAGEKKLEDEGPVEKKPARKPEEKRMVKWAQKGAMPPPMKQPGQRQQPQVEKKKMGDCFQEVVRRQQKEVLMLIPQGQNLMQKCRITFKRDDCLPVSPKNDLEILSEVNRAHFWAKVPHSLRIERVTKNTSGCLTMILMPGATAEMLIW